MIPRFCSSRKVNQCISFCARLTSLGFDLQHQTCCLSHLSQDLLQNVLYQINAFGQRFFQLLCVFLIFSATAHGNSYSYWTILHIEWFILGSPMRVSGFYSFFGGEPADGRFSFLNKSLVIASALNMARPLSTCIPRDRNKRHHLYVSSFGHFWIERGRIVEVKSPQIFLPVLPSQLKVLYISSPKATMILLRVSCSSRADPEKIGSGYSNAFG